MGFEDDTMTNSLDIGSKAGDSLMEPQTTNYSLKIDGDANLLSIDGNKEDLTKELVKMDLEGTLKALKGKENYYRNLVIMAVLAMLAASTTTYTLGLYTALPSFECL